MWNRGRLGAQCGGRRGRGLPRPSRDTGRVTQGHRGTEAQSKSGAHSALFL